MDELKIQTSFTRNIIKRILQKVLRKKLGVDITLQLGELTACIPKEDDGVANIQFGGAIYISKRDLERLIKQYI